MHRHAMLPMWELRTARISFPLYVIFAHRAKNDIHEEEYPAAAGYKHVCVSSKIMIHEEAYAKDWKNPAAAGLG
jgi:hypothetical protein